MIRLLRTFWGSRGQPCVPVVAFPCCRLKSDKTGPWQIVTVAFSTFAGMGMGLCGWMARPKKCLICLVDCCPPPVAPVMLALWKEKESNYTLKVILPPPTHHREAQRAKLARYSVILCWLATSSSEKFHVDLGENKSKMNHRRDTRPIKFPRRSLTECYKGHFK